ncbi:TonB-dependent heme/hemoglobin receptor family protein, partial [Serratia symbiotica str. Tucson]
LAASWCYRGRSLHHPRQVRRQFQ